MGDKLPQKEHGWAYVTHFCMGTFAIFLAAGHELNVAFTMKPTVTVFNYSKFICAHECLQVEIAADQFHTEPCWSVMKFIYIFIYLLFVSGHST